MAYQAPWLAEYEDSQSFATRAEVHRNKKDRRRMEIADFVHRVLAFIASMKVNGKVINIMKDSDINEDGLMVKEVNKQTEEKDKYTETKSIDKHPFSIESILNGTTKHRKARQGKNGTTLKQRRERSALPLNALEAFTNKAFLTMKPERILNEDEGSYKFSEHTVVRMSN